MQKRDFTRLIQNAFEISRSCQNFQRPTFFEVPFATPNMQFKQLKVTMTLDSLSLKSDQHQISPCNINAL